MAKLHFIRRTPSEIQIFGGTVYVDIDGKRVGMLAETDLVIDVEPGPHLIKMYKTHTFDTLIGFAEVNLNVEEGRGLTLRYSAPMVITQPGHIVVADFISQQDIEDLVGQKESSLKQEKQASDLQLKEQEEQQQKNNTALIFWIVGVPLIIMVVWYAIQMASLSSLY